MDMNKLLHGEIARELEKLKEMEVGSDQYEATVNGITKLWDRALEHEKTVIDEEIKLKQLEEDKRDHLIKNILAGAGIVIPVATTVWGTIKSIKFEETGTITTIMGRGFIQNLLPKKK